MLSFGERVIIGLINEASAHPKPSSRDWLRKLIDAGNATTSPKSDAAAGIEDRCSPSGPFFAPAAASGAERFSTDRVNQFMKLARAL